MKLNAPPNYKPFQAKALTPRKSQGFSPFTQDHIQLRFQGAQKAKSQEETAAQLLEQNPSPAAPPPETTASPFSDMPKELIQTIVCKTVSTSDYPYQAFEAIYNLRCTNKALKTGIDEEHPNYQTWKQQFNLQKEKWQRTRHQAKNFSASDFRWMPPSAHQILLNEALARPGDNSKSKAIQQLGPVLQYCSSEQRQALLEATLNIQDKYFKGAAIVTLGQRLQHFTPEQRQLLLGATLTLQEENKRLAIEGLAQGLQYLTPEQRQTLLEATLTLQEETNKSIAIEVLGQGLQYFSSEQRQTLLETTLTLQEEANKSIAIGGLAQGLQHFTPEQRQTLLEATLTLQEENKRLAIEGLVQGLQYFTPEQRQALLSAHERLAII